MAETFLAAGMKVVLSDIDRETLADTSRALSEAGGEVYSVVTDVSNADQVEDLAQETIERYGSVHVLCNNAGILIRGRSSWMNSLQDWRWIIGVNLMGVVHGIRSFLPRMIAQDSEAHIVNTASLGGLIPGGNTLYGATKFGVVGLSENLYLELLSAGLKPRVSVLCPGIVNTNIMTSSGRNRPAEFADPDAQPTPEISEELRRKGAEILKNSLSPRAVGEHVLDAIREERLYVLTHPELNAFIEQRTQNMVDGKNPAPLPMG